MCTLPHRVVRREQAQKMALSPAGSARADVLGGRGRPEEIPVIEEAFQRVGAGGGIGEGDVAVGPDEVRGAARETGRVHCVQPWECVEGEAAGGAAFGEGGWDVAVDMDLPGE